MSALNVLAPEIGLAPACAVLRINRAGVYRDRTRRRVAAVVPPALTASRPRSPLALSEPEQRVLLDVLYSERFADCAPRSVYATLLDEGTYLGSVRTMYRLLAALGQSRERRNQRVHPVYAKPELLAVRPNEVWSWDITKLKGPVKWSSYHLYVILDIFSRYVVGWMIALREAAQLAEALIAETVAKHHIAPGTLTLHADRGTSKAPQTRGRLARRSGSRQDPQPAACLRRQSVFRGPVQNAQVPSRLPRAVRQHRGCARPLPALLPVVQRHSPPLRHRFHDTRDRSLRPRPGSLPATCRHAQRRVSGQPETLQGKSPATAQAADRCLDQPT